MTEKIIDAKNKETAAPDADEIAASCNAVERYGNELIAPFANTKSNGHANARRN